MKPYTCVIVVCALLAAWVGAQAPRRVLPAEQVKLLQRNRSLYRAAIHSGLEASTQIDPLERAATSTALARRLSEEIQKAAQANDAARAGELALHLAELVDHGVAVNLRLARTRIEAGSEAEKTLFHRRDEVLSVLTPVEESLRARFPSHSHDLDPVLRQLAAGRAKLERSAKR